MGKFLKRTKLVMAFILMIAIAFICGFGKITTTVKAEETNSAEYITRWYNVTYDSNSDSINVILSTDISSYGSITRADLSVFKNDIKDLVIRIVKDDIDLTQYGSNNRNRVRLNKTILLGVTHEEYINSLAGADVDVSVLEDILKDQNFTQDKLDVNYFGGTYDKAIEYFVDRYVDAYMQANPTKDQDDVLTEVATKVKDYAETEIEKVYDALSIDPTLIVNSSNDKIDELINNVKDAKTAGTPIEISVGDVKQIFNSIEDTSIITDYVKNIDVATEVSNILSNSAAAEITDFLTTVDTDKLVEVVKDSKILTGNNLKTIVENVNVDQLIEIANEVSLDGLADLASAAGLNKETLNEIVREKAKTITINDLLKIVNSIKVDDITLYDGGIKASGIKSLLSSLTKPGEIVNMTDAQLKFTHNVKVDTSFGTIDFDFTIDFDGNKDRIRNLCKVISDHIDVYNDNGVYTFKFKLPEKSGEYLTKFINKDYLDNELLQRIFDDTSLTIDELYQKFNATDLDEYIELLKMVDYKAILKDVLDGEKLSSILGVNITDERIDKVIDFAIKAMRKLEDTTYADILALLDDYIDVSQLQNAKLETLYSYMIAAFNKIDDGTLSASKIREWINSDTSTNESVYVRIDKLANYSDKFDKLKTYVTKVYNHIPDRYLEKTIFDVYDGNGVFDVTVDVNIDAIIDLMPQKIQDAIGVFVDNLPSRKDIRLQVTVPHFYKVEYHIGNLVKTGFLPVGAKLADFSGETLVNGLAIEYYADELGQEVEFMPDRDCVITAYAQMVVTNSADINKVYDGVTETLEVTVDPVGVYNYQWYKNGLEILGARSSTYEVLDVNDSGVYTCVIDNGIIQVTSDPINVTITKSQIDVSDYEWTALEDRDFTYDGLKKIVQIVSAIDSKLKVEYTNNSAINAGDDYVATVTFTLKDRYSQNYELVGSVDPCTWSIKKAQIDASLFTWTQAEDRNFTYVPGANNKVQITNETYLANFDYTNNEKEDAGSYTASVTVTAKDPANYEIIGSVADLSWEVKKAQIDVSGYTWTSINTFTYDGTNKTVELAQPVDEKLNVSYSNNTKKDANSYTAKVTLTVKDAYKANYEITGSVSSFKWKINKASINASDFTWSVVTEFTYDGTEKSVAITNESNLVNFTYKNNKNTNAGSYSASVKLVAKDATNYEIVGSVADLAWKINKATIDIKDYQWMNAFDRNFVYDGTEKTVTIATEMDDKLDVLYTNNVNINAGAYTASVAFTVKEAYKNNYELVGSVSDLNWEIKKATLDGSIYNWKTPTTFTYDKQTHKMTLADVDSKLNVEYFNNKASEVGTYTATAFISLKNEYAANYELINGDKVTPLTWTITPGFVDISGYHWQEVSEFTYDGTVKTVELVGYDEEMFEVVYTENNKVSVGKYVASVQFKLKEAYKNLSIKGSVAPLEWTINKATVDVSGYVWTTQDSFVYDGNKHGVTIASEISNLVYPIYSFNENTEAGNYTASVIFKLYDTVNYQLTGTVADKAYTIAKAKISVSDYDWQKERKFDYTGSPITVLLASKVDSKLNVHYTDNEKTEVGTYTAKVTFTVRNEYAANYQVVGQVGELNFEICKVAEKEPEKKYDFDPYVDDKGNESVVIKSEDGVDEEYELIIKEVKPNVDSDEKLIIIDGYDIHFEKEGTEETPAGTYKVRLYINDELQAMSNLKVIHIFDNGTYEYVEDAVRNGKYMEFSVESFSVYAVVAIAESVNIIYIILGAVALVAVLVILIVLFKKHDDGEDGNIDPFIVKLGSSSKETQGYYNEIKDVANKYEDRIKMVINEYYELFICGAKTVATLDIKNGFIIVKVGEKTVTVKNQFSLISGKKLLKNALSKLKPEDNVDTTDKSYLEEEKAEQALTDSK